MLKDKVLNQWKDAYKNKNIELKSAFESVKAKILVEEKSGKYQLPLEDSIIENLIIKEIKELKETQSYYNNGDSNWSSIQRKINALSEYLPKQMSEDEVKSIIVKLKETENNMGKLIGLVVKEVGSRFDKSQISKLVKEVINNG